MLNKLSFFLRLVVAVILLQSLYFKFGGHAEAVHIFSTLGVESWGRIGLGCVELFVALTLLIPKTQVLASFASLGVFSGAIGTHLFTPVGIVVQWDGNSDNGQLFFYGDTFSYFYCGSPFPLLQGKKLRPKRVNQQRSFKKMK